MKEDENIERKVKKITKQSLDDITCLLHIFNFLKKNEEFHFAKYYFLLSFATL